MAYDAGDTLVRVVMEASTGLIEDQIVNDFAFKFDGTPAASDYAALLVDVDAFYAHDGTSTLQLGEYISNAVNRAATHHMVFYKIVAGPLGSPVAELDWLGPATMFAGSKGLPTEVAGVLSFHADLTGISEESGATRPRARRRGRVFIGPLANVALSDSTPPYRLHADFTLTLREAANAMGDAADADGWTWSVWSRTDAELRPVVGGWTDNAPDTQRRRGPAASIRTTWTR